METTTEQPTTGSALWGIELYLGVNAVLLDWLTAQCPEHLRAELAVLRQYEHQLYHLLCNNPDGPAPTVKAFYKGMLQEAYGVNLCGAGSGGC